MKHRPFTLRYFIVVMALVAIAGSVALANQTTVVPLSLGSAVEANSTTARPSEKAHNANPLLNLKVSTGAAPGYVDDAICGTCHADLYASYQAVGMAKSFTTPQASKFVEDFSAPAFFHGPSQRYYHISKTADELTFERYQLDDQGQRINEFKHKIDFILGSGHKARSYLYRVPSGEIFQLPIGWYSQEQKWGMSPGYDNAEHQGVARPVPRQCLFCHNAFPQVPKGSDQHWQPHTFPEQLPHGTGCQRCHGPGSKHVKTVTQGADSIEQIHASIVNPAKLPIDKRDSVCFQCHLLPSVDLVGVRDFSRADYSFRPGEDINDYLHHVDIVDEVVSQKDRFEINHHAYRLRQSSCFLKSQGALTCISCHNPHRKVAVEQRAEHYAAVCQSCHQEEHQPPLKENKDCVSCHMPQRRTQDVVRVVMTDHKIQRNNDGIDWLAPLKETQPIITDMDFLMAEKSPAGDLGQIYKVVTMLKAKVLPNYVDYLQSMLSKVDVKDSMPYFELASAQLSLKRYQDAERTSRWLIAKYPDNFRAKQWLATALTGLGRNTEAEKILQSLIVKQPQVTEIHFNYALLLFSQKRYEAAHEQLQMTVQLRPNFAVAWYYLGKVAAALQQQHEAIKDYRRALELEPRLGRAYLELADSLVAIGDKPQALRFLKQGAKVSNQVDAINDKLKQLKLAL